jgi:hypothetical protein
MFYGVSDNQTKEIEPDGITTLRVHFLFLFTMAALTN